MSKDGVYELFLSVLQVQGYVAVPAGDVTLIVQQNEMKQQGRDLEETVSVDSQELLTKVIMIKNTPALDLVPILRPLVAKYGHLAGRSEEHTSELQSRPHLVCRLLLE